MMTTAEVLQESSLDESLAAALADAEPQDEAAEPEAVEAAEPTTEEVLEALEPAPKWDKRYKEVFSHWMEAGEDGNPLYPNGRDWQQAMLDLYKEQQGYATKVEQERAEARKQAEEYQQYLNQFSGILSPYRDFITQSGQTPDVSIRQGLGLLQQLQQDPQATLLRLAREKNVNLQEALSEQPWQSPESREVEQLKKQLDAMKQEQVQREQRQVQMQMQRLRAENEAQIKAFAEATDESGNPAHPHLDKVQTTMAELIMGREQLRRNNPQLPQMGLDEAYQRAVQLTPELVAEAEKEAESKRLAEKAAEAKKAAVPAKRVKTGSAGKSKPSLSLDQQIEAAQSQMQ